MRERGALVGAPSGEMAPAQLPAESSSIRAVPAADRAAGLKSRGSATDKDPCSSGDDASDGRAGGRGTAVWVLLRTRRPVDHPYEPAEGELRIHLRNPLRRNTGKNPETRFTGRRNGGGRALPPATTRLRTRTTAGERLRRRRRRERAKTAQRRRRSSHGRGAAHGGRAAARTV